MDKEYPLYGKLATPAISPEEWWSELIRRCLKEAGASDRGEHPSSTLRTSSKRGRQGKDADRTDLARSQEKACSALLARFESDVGYRAFPETLESRKPHSHTIYPRGPLGRR